SLRLHPTLQKKHGIQQYIPRPPTVDSQHSTAPLSERSLSGLQSPPVPACRNQLRAADIGSALKDVFDMARLRLQAPVRRPNSRNMEPRNLMRIHDSLQLKYTDYFDLSPPGQNDYLRSVMGVSERGSLLESESAFIGDAFPVPRTPEFKKIPQLSARERRRLAKHLQPFQERAASVGQHDDYAAHTGNRLQQEMEQEREGRSRGGTGRLMALGRRGNTAGPVDLSDDDSSPPHFSAHNRNCQRSIETVTTDPWMRPGHRTH
ncbi:hypothetical protein INR49_028403, partial [Caranx melampygus]